MAESKSRFSKFGSALKSLKSSALRKAAQFQGARRDIETHKHGGAAGSLDLTYITPKLIAMAGIYSGLLSSSGPNLAADVEQYLHRQHGAGSCRIFVVGSTSCDVELKIKVDNKHNGAGSLRSLKRLYRAAKAVLTWINSDDDHVAIVMCADGLGPTGTVIAASLVLSGLVSDPAKAVRTFTAKRVVESKPVLTPAQLRYVRYIGHIAQQQRPAAHEISLKRLHVLATPDMSSQTQGCRPYVSICLGQREVFNSKPGDGSPPRLFGPDDYISFELDVHLLGDLTIQIWHHSTIMTSDNSKLICACQQYTGYMQADTITLRRHELDLVDPKCDATPTPFALRLDIERTGSHPDQLLWLDHPVPTFAAASLFACKQDEQDFQRDLELLSRAFTQPAASYTDGPVTDQLDFSDDDEDIFGADAQLRTDKQQVKEPSPPTPDANLLDLGTAGPAPSAPSAPTSTAPVGDLLGFDFAAPAASSTNNGSISNHGSAGNGMADLLGGLSMDTSSIQQPTQQQQQQQQTNGFDAFGDLTSPSSNAHVTQPGNRSTPLSPATSTSAADPFAGLFTASNSTPAATNVPMNSMHTSASMGSMSGIGPMGTMGTSSVPTSARTSTATSHASTTQASRSASVSASDPFGDLFSSSGTQPQPTTTTPQPGSTSTRPAPTQPQAAAPRRSSQSFTNQPTPGSVFGDKSSKQSTNSSSGMFDDLITDPRLKRKEDQKQSLASLLKGERLKTEDPVLLAVEEWCEGKENNLRALLSSMHEVLWEGARWRKADMSKLMDGNTVRKTYQRACLVVHPDKCTGEPHEKLAREVFMRLSFAYTVFTEGGSQ